GSGDRFRLVARALSQMHHRDRQEGTADVKGPETVTLRPISAEAAAAVLSGRRPPDVRLADDYPTEFSQGIARQVGRGSPLGPFFVHRSSDDVVIGEIGGGITSPGVAEIGYAIVPSCWGHGHATDAVRLLIAKARDAKTINRL